MDPAHSHPRIAAVDFGTRRVGLAVTDPLGLFAQPAGTFGPGTVLAELQRLHAAHGLSGVVVGWPLDDGEVHAVATARVGPFVGRLRKSLPGVPVHLQDERDSSRRAVEALLASGRGRKARREKGRVDAAAAVVILTDWLAEHGDGFSGGWPGR